MLKDDDELNAKDTWLQRFTGEEITCPVCSVTVRGDRDVVDAHVDTCLAHENQRMEEARLLELQRRVEEEETWGDDGNYVGSVRGVFPRNFLSAILTFFFLLNNRCWILYTHRGRGGRGRYRY